MKKEKFKFLLFYVALFLLFGTIVCALTDNFIILFVSGVISSVVSIKLINYFSKKESHGNRSK